MVIKAHIWSEARCYMTGLSPHLFFTKAANLPTLSWMHTFTITSLPSFSFFRRESIGSKTWLLKVSLPEIPATSRMVPQGKVSISMPALFWRCIAFFFWSVTSGGEVGFRRSDYSGQWTSDMPWWPAPRIPPIQRLLITNEWDGMLHHTWFFFPQPGWKLFVSFVA